MRCPSSLSQACLSYYLSVLHTDRYTAMIGGAALLHEVAYILEPSEDSASTSDIASSTPETFVTHLYPGDKPNTGTCMKSLITGFVDRPPDESISRCVVRTLGHILTHSVVKSSQNESLLPLWRYTTSNFLKHGTMLLEKLMVLIRYKFNIMPLISNYFPCRRSSSACSVITRF